MEFQGSINLPLAYIDHKAIQIYLSVSVSSLFLFIALFCLELKAKHVVVKKINTIVKHKGMKENKMFGYDCNLVFLKREWTLRRFWRFGERFAWYVLKHM